MKKIILLSFSFFLTGLIALEEDTLSALRASYEDSNLILEGEVKLHHGLGTLQSEKASLYKQEDNKEILFSKVYLQDNVQILCKNKASLICDIADLDFITLQGKLSSKAPHLVTYVDKVLNTSEGTPFQIQGSIIDLIFDKKEDDYTFNSITAKENVNILYAKDFALKADEAHYIKAPFSPSLSGTITAYPTSNFSFCHLCYQNENIDASFVEIILEKNFIHLKDPKGSLPSNLFSQKQTGQLFFTCKDLTWDHLKGILVLKQDIQIEESHFGHLSADHELTIEQNKTQDSTFIKTLHVEGKSSLSHDDSLLISYGSLHVNGLKGHITALSPKVDGKTSLEEQLLYQNSDMCLQADTAFLEYTEPLHELSSLTFQGNVRIRSLDTAKAARYALADKLLYVPDTKTVILSARAGKKVLFWDEEQGATLSAKEVHLTQNPLTNKTEIKGVGNMKVSLSKEEQNELKNNFPAFPNLEETYVK